MHVASMYHHSDLAHRPVKSCVNGTSGVGVTLFSGYDLRMVYAISGVIFILLPMPVLPDCTDASLLMFM